jgi:hypothetical protein
MEEKGAAINNNAAIKPQLKENHLAMCDAFMTKRAYLLSPTPMT